MTRESIIRHIREYLARSDVFHPLFIAFDFAGDLTFLLNELGTSCETIVLSSFCHGVDAFPNLDLFFDKLQEANKTKLVLGCGEYAELEEDGAFLSRLFDFPCSSGQKLVIPLWNGFDFLERMCKDPRMDNLRMLSFVPLKRFWHLKIIPTTISLSACQGFRHILEKLERGADQEITVQTACDLNGKWCKEIKSAYDLYCAMHSSTNLSATLFNEDQWKRQLDENRIRDEQIWSPDTFLRWKEVPPQDNAYLGFVLNRTETYSDYRYNLLASILEVPLSSNEFPALYDGWKKVQSKFPDDDIRLYLEEAQRYGVSERLSYLTCNTRREQLEILDIVTKTKEIPLILDKVYPSLALYSSQYRFNIPGLQDFSEALFKYFEAYKFQKLHNELSHDFRELMEWSASERPYNLLPTRGATLEKLKGENVHLFWLDALGCEFLGFIQHRAEELGLRLNIHVARATLPTLTSVNRDFYEEWNCGTKEQSKELDVLKHGDFDDYGYSRSGIPVELVYELDVIDKTLDSIAKGLKARKYAKAILASDHGATRLAIVSEDETDWEFPEKGKHGGRCCKISEFDGVLPPYVTHDDCNEWNVMANYSRFKGGRKGDVEVHGGATLEEVVIPVIEFELLDKSIKVELVNKEIKTSFRDSVIRLQLFCAKPICDLSVEWNGKRYNGITIPDAPLKHDVELPRPKTGEYKLTAFDGDTRLNQVEFSVKSTGTGVKKDNFF